MKKILITLLVILGFWANAQQDAQYTQYMFNALALNPGYAGSHDAISSTLLFRKQWVGIQGAPSTTTFSVHSPLANHPVGIGLQLVQDQIGVSSESNIYGSYAYYLSLTDKTRLSMGLQVGATLLSSNWSDLTTVDGDDNDFTSGDIKGTKPNFGTGLYIHSEKYYLGLSVPRIMKSKFSSSGGIDYQQTRHYFLMGGYVFDFGSNFKLKPNSLIKVVQGAPMELDLNLNALFIERIWFGVSWRSFDSFDFIAEYLLNEQLRIGYAYDLTLTPLKSHTSGSHEFMLNYVFKYTKDKALSPRYF